MKLSTPHQSVAGYIINSLLPWDVVLTLNELMCRKCLGVLHLHGEILAPKAAAYAASLDQTELFQVHLTFFFKMLSLDGKCLFPLGHPTGPSPESA